VLRVHARHFGAAEMKLLRSGSVVCFNNQAPALATNHPASFRQVGGDLVQHAGEEGCLLRKR
jgi:hypothetical protein